MSRTSLLFGALVFMTVSACTTSPLKSLPPALPLAEATVSKDATNAGRVQSIAVSPTDKNHAIIAMEFGGLWHTFGGGNAWFRIHTLPAVFVSDVEFGSDGKTVVAAVQRDNKTSNGGGIYVSHTSGDFWSRPPTGVVPAGPSGPARTSAHSVSHAPDERGLWYVGTDFGVAISGDDGASWSHVPLNRVQSVLAMPNGSVLAMTATAVHRSDDRGATWRMVIQDNFAWESFTEPTRGGNKMDRSPYAPWAFIFKDYKYDGIPPRKGSGALWFYELDTDTKTLIPLPQGRWRGPFVRVSKDPVYGGRHISIWVGEGWDGYYVTREDAASIRAIRSDAQWDDWVSFIAPAGIHADMGDMGVDGELQPTLVGTDGGIFKPHPSIAGRWMSAAVPGSGMNSLQITDLAGTNITQTSGQVKTSLYFATQDNKIWASPDGGQTWPASDDQEGYGLEVRPYARAGEPVTVAYVREGVAPKLMFAGTNLTNRRAVPALDQNGNALDGQMAQPFFLSQQAGSTSAESFWVRLRSRTDVPGREVYVSGNSGKNWQKIADLNLDPKGEIKSSAGGVVAWIPVGSPNIGLLPLTPLHNFLNNTIQTYDDSDVVSLPNNGSLGLRATMFDWHAVFGVHPLDWKFLIAPDIKSNDVKISRDGGNTWMVDVALTQQVLRGGELLLWDGSAYRMQVTEIAFEPPPPAGRYGNRIFVGTRDAGIICSADDAKTWRTIKDSDKIKYVTGFHFQENGGVYVSSYGHGLWHISPAQGCPEAYSLPWDVKPPVADPSPGLVATMPRTADMPATPRGIPAPNNPKLFLTGSVSGSGIAVVGTDNLLNISGRGFPAGGDVVLTSPDGAFQKQSASIDKSGQFALSIRLPEDLPFGAYTIEASPAAGDAPPISAGFVKALIDEEVDKKAVPGQERRE